ncbi:hybrid sensor histidine kinase/response regulator [Thermomonas alba]|uniref:hybrid sensor histidine kinase/response regulator n=1 Tax=Thermomonas alba TaxID=2888525 RepID=UPI001F03FAD0|nr:hybrid sensor histidine kinase/response regulator [Thermomonas alba]
MHRRFALLLWLACACACAWAAAPERPRFRITGPAQGLPSTEIKALVRDADGYLWIGTTDGLARHDGVDMRVWRHDPDVADGLPGNNVQALLVDARNQIWVAVEGEGVSVLDAAREHFRHLRKADHPQLGSDDVWAMARQGDAVWLGTYDGGLTRVAADGGMRHYGVDAGLPAPTVLALAVDADGVLWVGTTEGLARQRGDRFEPVNLPEAEGLALVYGLSAQRDGLWVGSSQGVWRRAEGRWTQPAWSPMFQRPNAMMAIVTDAQGDHWIGSQRGLWYQHQARPPVPVPLGGPAIPRAIGALLGEKGNALWVPVFGRGLGYLRSDWRQMAVYQGVEDGLNGAMYRALGKARDGGVWLGGLGGVIEHMAPDGSLSALPDAVLERLRSVKPAAVAEDADGRLWIAHRGGLIRIVGETVTEWTAEDAQAPVPVGQIGFVRLARDGRLWLAAVGGGVQQRDPASGAILRDLRAGEQSGLGEADIEDMALAADDAPWLATSTGVLRFDPVAARFVPVPAMGQGRVYALAFDGADTLWLQRLAGLEGYRRQGAQWRRIVRIDIRHGMPAVAAAALLVDARHRVWITTSRGLYRWDPSQQRLAHMGARDDTGGEEYLDRAAVLRDDGLLVAGTADGGLRMVDTAMADPSPPPPRLRFDSLAVRRHGAWQPLPAGPQSRLTPEDRELRIRFRLLDFDDPAGNRYWAYLEGFDRGWVALGASGDRVFAGLMPGRYVLRVRAQDAAGNPAPEQALAFEIPPPWWRTGWALAAYALIAALVLLLAARAYRLRLHRLHALRLAEEKRALAEQASQAKSRFLATLGHEVRTPMTGVLGMAELLRASPLDARQRGWVEAIHRAGEHLLRLVNDALDLARIEAGKLELAQSEFSLRALLDEVAGLLAPVAERKGLRFVVEVADDVPAGLRGDCTRVRQILLNLLANAIKFTDAGEVRLQVAPLAPQGVRCLIRDTGPGLSQEQQQRLFQRFEQAEGARTHERYGGSGLGLAISQELAAAMGGRITVESTLGAGASFTVELPLPVVEMAAPVTPAQDSAASTRTLRLLLVEDDPIIAEVIAGLLQAQGHTVTHVGHALGALSEASAGAFDAALLDLDLPGMDGLALAQTLRAQGFTAPLLAVTARSDAQAEAQARAAGFDGFLRKPVSGERLARALDAVLAAHPQALPACAQRAL